MGWILLSCAVTMAQAQDSTPAPAAQTLQEQTPQVDLPAVLGNSPATGGGGEVTRGELGIVIGAFTLYPMLDIQVGYDTNVYATPAPTVGSPYTYIRPSLELKSEWSRHEIRLLANGGFGFYPSATSQNYQNYTFQFDGRLDIRNDFYASTLR